MLAHEETELQTLAEVMLWCQLVLAGGAQLSSLVLDNAHSSQWPGFSLLLCSKYPVGENFNYV